MGVRKLDVEFIVGTQAAVLIQVGHQFFDNDREPMRVGFIDTGLPREIARRLRSVMGRGRSGQAKP